MIRFFNHNEIDKNAWDEVVKSSRFDIIYAYSWYLDAVAPNWNALIEDDYKIIMPLTHRKKWNISYLFQPPFAQQLGVFSKLTVTQVDLEKFIKAISEYFRFIEINFNQINNLSNTTFDIKANLNYELHIYADYNLIRKNFSSNHKRALAKFAASDLELTEDADPDAVIQLFKENRGKSFFKENDYQILRKIRDELSSRKLIKVTGVLKRGKLIAGIYWVKSSNRWIFLFSGSDEEARASRAMFGLVNDFIQKINKGEVVDFEGSNNPDLARFYKGFGAVEKLYYSFRLNNLTFPLNLFK
jgi:hypothetical protein